MHSGYCILGIFPFLILIPHIVAQDTRFRTYGPATIDNYTFPYRRGGDSFNGCVSSKTAANGGSVCLADFFTVGQINDRQTGPYASLDDAKVFLRWGFLRETRPRRWDCHIGLDLSVTNWFTTTRCYDQMGTDKYEELLRNEGIFSVARYILKIGRLGVQRGQEYKQDVLQQIYDAEKDLIPTLIQNAYNANKTRAIVFEVGNEPNVHPAMSPELYGWYLKLYADRIRQAASQINNARPKDTPEIRVKIMSGGLWIFDGMPSYMMEAFNRGVRISFGAITVDLPIRIKICKIGRSWWAIRFPCGIDYQKVELTEGMDIKSNFYTDILAYWQRLVAAAGSGTIDIAGLHFYPYISRDARFGMQEHLSNLRGLVAGLSGKVSTGEVWLTEIGNFNPYSDKEAAEKVMSPLVTGLRDSSFSSVTRWYWFINYGKDKKFRYLPGGISELMGGVWASLFEIFVYFLDLTGGLVTVVEPRLDDARVANILAFAGDFGAKNPAQGLYESEASQTLTELGVVYQKFATGQL